MMKSKKRIVSMLTVLAMVLVMMPAMVFADTDAGTAKVFVTLADEGSLVMTQEKVTVSDIDADGALTINDALYAVHEASYEGGAAAGYASGMSDWGLSLTKLWGDTSGAFGYYVNDASAWSLTDPVKDGDAVYAYIYKDQTAWSDKYSFFDQKTLEAAEGEEVELTLSYQDYDENWNKVSKPAAGVQITIDGEPTGNVTDSEGRADIKLTAGTHIISAMTDTMILVPPVCTATVTPAPADVIVTISDKGTLVMTQEKVTVTDIDGDGALTINDALYAAHEHKAGYEGGAAAGYASAMSDWGLSITKLWGDTSGAFGYCVNDASAWGLTDPVEDGDYVNAYIYKDQSNWSDKYTFFDRKTLTAAAGEAVELTLSYQDYDENWNKVSKPAANVEITVDGKVAGVTDAEGKIVLTLEEGSHVIGFKSEELILVPDVCLAEITEAYNSNATAPEENEDNSIKDNDDVTGDPAENEGNQNDDINNGVEQNEENNIPYEGDDVLTEDPVTDNVEQGTVASDKEEEQSFDESSADTSDKEIIDTEPAVKADNSAQTGDDFNAVLYGFIALTAFATAVFCLRRRTCK